ncbi:unnamed protein product [Clonostachys rosea]|uniref:2-dehydropantoate 2-reductase n=1 Tax=Bionectria ochroleuca TaxID=29856 RepID=A0ABY6UN38_BIOOC|nr:unnamed protein product [Clonostachys rosea]
MAVTQARQVLIFGSGAIGITFGSLFMRCPNLHVSMLCRSNFDVARDVGFKHITATNQEHSFRPHSLVRSFQDIRGKAFDYIICSNKAYTRDGACWLADLDQLHDQRTVFVAAQNGLLAANQLSKRFPHSPVLSAICYVGCQQTPLGVVREHSRMNSHAFSLGLATNNQATEAARQFIVSTHPTQIRATDNLRKDMWEKAVFNAAVNTSTALLNQNTHQVVQSLEGRSWITDLASEATSVAILAGVDVRSDMPRQVLNHLAAMPPFVPSMLQDKRRQKPLEIESICGHIMDIAEDLGVFVPRLSTILACKQDQRESDKSEE